MAHEQLTLITDPHTYFSATKHRGHVVLLPCYHVRTLDSNDFSGTIPDSLGALKLIKLYVWSPSNSGKTAFNSGAGIGVCNYSYGGER